MCLQSQKHPVTSWTHHWNILQSPPYHLLKSPESPFLCVACHLSASSLGFCSTFPFTQNWIRPIIPSKYHFYFHFFFSSHCCHLVPGLLQLSYLHPTILCTAGGVTFLKPPLELDLTPLNIWRSFWGFPTTQTLSIACVLLWSGLVPAYFSVLMVAHTPHTPFVTYSLCLSVCLSVHLPTSPLSLPYFLSSYQTSWRSPIGRDI